MTDPTELADRLERAGRKTGNTHGHVEKSWLLQAAAALRQQVEVPDDWWANSLDALAGEAEFSTDAEILTNSAKHIRTLKAERDALKRTKDAWEPVILVASNEHHCRICGGDFVDTDGHGVHCPVPKALKELNDD